MIYNTKTIKDIRLASTPINEVYKGNTLIWRRAPNVKAYVTNNRSNIALQSSWQDITKATYSNLSSWAAIIIVSDYWSFAIPVDGINKYGYLYMEDVMGEECYEFCSTISNPDSISTFSSEEDLRIDHNCVVSCGALDDTYFGRTAFLPGMYEVWLMCNVPYLAKLLPYKDTWVACNYEEGYSAWVFSLRKLLFTKIMETLGLTVYVVANLQIIVVILMG